MPQTRNVVRYGSAGLFLTDSPGSKPEEESVYFLNRVQSVDFSISVNRQNLKQIGSENFIDRKIVSEPDISLNFDYLLTDGYEENVLGLNVFPGPLEYTDYYGIRDASFDFTQMGTIYNNIREDKNAFLVVGPEGFELMGGKSNRNSYSGYDAIGFGNTFITNYSVQAAVGSLARASVSMKCSDAVYSCVNKEGGYQWLETFLREASVLDQEDFDDDNFIRLESFGRVDYQDAGTPDQRLVGGLEVPSLDLPNKGSRVLDDGVVFDPVLYNSAVSAITPGGINLIIRNLDHGGPVLNEEETQTCFKSTAAIQSFEINVPFERHDLYGFESMHAYGRKMKYPQVGTMSLELTSSTFESGRFTEILCNDELYEVEITLKNNCQLSCMGSKSRDKFMKFTINNAKFDNYSFNSNLDSSATVSCQFSFGMSRDQGFMASGTYFNSADSPCSMQRSMAPRNMEVYNVSEMGEKDAPKNVRTDRV